MGNSDDERRRFPVAFSVGSVVLLAGAAAAAWPVLFQAWPQVDASSAVVLDLRAVAASESEPLTVDLGPELLGASDSFQFTALVVDFLPMQDGDVVVELFGAGSNALEDCSAYGDEDGDGLVDITDESTIYDGNQEPSHDEGQFGAYANDDSETNSATVALHVIGGARTAIYCSASLGMTYTETLGQRRLSLPDTYILSDRRPDCVAVKAPEWYVPSRTYLDVQDGQCREKADVAVLYDAGEAIADTDWLYPRLFVTGEVAAEGSTITALIWWSGVLLGLGTACLAPIVTWLDDLLERRKKNGAATA